MELYYAPLACSLATRIALAEVGLEATLIEVDRRTKRAANGQDLTALNPLGLVPTLRTDDGRVLTENVAVLLHVADTAGQLAPEGGPARIELYRWLGFISTELHKGVFNPLFDANAPDEAKAYAVQKSASRLAYLDGHLEGRAHLLDDRSVADLYLVTVLNWAQATPIDLAAYPNVEAYLRREAARPHVAAAIQAELPLYLAERKRARAAS